MNSSPEINELATALATAQGQIEAACKDKLNPHFKAKYADLASVWAACRVPLSENGLAVVQAPRTTTDGRIELQTILMHKSGQWIQGELLLPDGLLTAQQIGSALTYSRRYGLGAMVGVCPEDDDGEAATHRGEATQAWQQPAPAARSSRPGIPRAPKPSPPEATRPAPPAAPAPAAKHDDRPFSTLVSDELDRRHKEYREDHPGAKDVINVYEANRHLLKTAVFEKRTADPGKATDGKVRQILGELYRKPELYGPMRKELSAYLTAKFKEAHEKAVAEEQGDGDAFEGLVEVEGGELVPAVPAAEVLEPDAGERG